MNTFVLGILFLCAGMVPAFAAVQTEEIDYVSGDTTMKGYLAYDDSTDAKRPGVIVVHEWWGHNEYARKRARMLAELGYVAFAVDMYGDGRVAEHPKEAGEYMQAVAGNQEVSKARFMAGLEVLKAFRLTDTARLAAIGYCFGGATVLNRALEGADLAGVVSFHGALQPPAEDLPKGQVKAKILICHGGADSFAPAEQVAAYRAALDKSGADYIFNVYEGAKHGFTNPDADALAAKFGMDIAYNPQADAKSWEDMKEFFKKLF